MLQTGDRMPAFTLRNTAREDVTEKDLLGQITVVAFYPLAFTGG